MICESYSNLTPLEKVDFIGKLVHAVQSSEWCFTIGKTAISRAEENGFFEGVKINPERDETTESSDSL